MGFQQENKGTRYYQSYMDRQVAYVLRSATLIVLFIQNSIALDNSSVDAEYDRTITRFILSL